MSFLSELKRRNVLRVGAAYIVATWLLIQVADTLFPVFGFGDAAVRIVVIVLAILFIPAVIVAWVFELTPEGLKRDDQVDRSRSITSQIGKKLDRITMVALAFALGYFAFDKFVLTEPREASIAEIARQEGRSEALVESFGDKSVAVLPFANRSAREEDIYFVDGIHNDILTQLTRIDSLSVISRTSVEKFRDTTQSMKEIGATLGVKTILEGGVQRAGNRVRINVMLTDATVDKNLWATSYDRELSATNIFAIQSEISTAIAQALEATLTPWEEEQLAIVPTENMLALESYFLGQQAMLKRTAASLADAETHFKRTIELDPDYAQAYVYLAITYQGQVFYGNRPESEAEALGVPLINKALAINDRLGEAHIAMTNFADDSERAEMLFRKGLDLTPGLAYGHRWFAVFLNRQERQEEALVQLKEAARLDPMASFTRITLGETLRDLGRFDDARNQYELITRIDPGLAIPYWTLGYLDLFAYGRVDDAIVRLRQGAAIDPGDPKYPADLAMMWSLIGGDLEADQSLERARAISADGAWVLGRTVQVKLSRGEVAQTVRDAEALFSEYPSDNSALTALGLNDVRLGDADKALERYDTGYPMLMSDGTLESDRSAVADAVRIGWLLQQVGDAQRADLLFEQVMEFIQTIPRLGRLGYMIADVQIYTMKGMKDEALLALRQAVDEGWRGNWRFFLQHDPILAPLHDEPEYQLIVAELEADMAAQLQRVREMETNGELASIPE